MCFVALALGGCTPHFFETPDTYHKDPLQIAPHRSVVVLPASFAEERLAVRQRIDGDDMLERVVLANNTTAPGENEIVVRTKRRGTLVTYMLRGGFDNPYSEGSVKDRIAEEFPGHADVSTPLDRANRHGPYRYVTATYGDVHCILAWQLMDAQAAATGQTHTFAVDMRLCDKDRDTDELIALFDQIDLSPHL
ncbi:MAG: cellulose biosynthesis protein BcsN [Pseudomonadota bacterium]